MATAHQIRDLITQTTTGSVRPRVPRGFGRTDEGGKVDREEPRRTARHGRLRALLGAAVQAAPLRPDRRRCRIPDSISAVTSKPVAIGESTGTGANSSVTTAS